MSSPAGTRRSKPASERKWYSSPSTSPGRGGRVVADTDTSSSGTCCTSERIRVPFPTPEGPVITKTLLTAAPLTAQHRDQLGALALREAADGLARRDPALLEDLVGLHAAVLGDGQEHVEDLRGLHPRGRIEQQPVDRGPAGLEVPLELRAAGPDLVGALERLHSLHQ